MAPTPRFLATARSLVLSTVLLTLASAGSLHAQTPAAATPMAELAREQFAFAARQYAGLLARIQDNKDRIPRTWDGQQVKLVPPRDWTSGFFAGSLWLIFEQTRDPALRAAAEDFTRRVESIKDFTDHHDVGFMLGCSYGQGLRIAGTPGYRDVLIQGARSLATRYDARTGVIKSWNSTKTWQYPVIIDNMMNLELLVFAARESGDASLQAIALSHARKTLQYHFRPDGSSYHLLDYSVETGAPRRWQTVQGYADNSAWARGQSWGLYGFTRMYVLTKDPAFLAQALKIAEFIANHPRLPADGVPYWDFDAPNIPDAIRDASAAAVMACGFQELATVAPAEAADRYRALAERQLRSLASSAYRAGLNENGNFLLRHSVGHLGARTEIDVPLNYADYYFLEALSRYLK